MPPKRQVLKDSMSQKFKGRSTNMMAQRAKASKMLR